MIELKNEKIAIPIVLFAGILWSFGPLVVRYMDNPQLVPWQYIFGSGLTIFIILNLYLYFEEGLNFYKNYKKIGLSGVIGGSGLGIAMMSFHLFNHKYYSCNNFIMFSCNAFFYCNISFFIFKRKNFTKCLDINFYCNCRHNYYGNW